MENNKLDNLFDAARKQQTSVSFEETMYLLNKKAEDSKYVGGGGIFRFRNLFLGVISAVVIVAGTYLALRTDNQRKEFEKVQESILSASESSNVGQVPVAIESSSMVKAEDKKPGNNSALRETISPLVNDKEEVIAITKPAVKKKDEHFGSIVNNAYLLENQTVNINNEKGKFRVHFNGNEVAKIEMNDTLLPGEEWANYSDIVSEARLIKATMGINTGNTGNKKFVDYLFSSLKEKGLIENNLSSIRFSKENLLIDGVQVDSATHQQLIDRYKSLMGEDIGSRTLYFN